MSTDEETSSRPLSPAMQRHVLAAILTDSRLFAQSRSFLTPDTFKDDACSDVYAAAAGIWDRSREIPSKVALLDLFSSSDHEAHRVTINKAFKGGVTDASYTIERIAKYARNIAMRQALVQAAALIKYQETGDEGHLESAPRDKRGRPIKDADPISLIQRASAVGTSVGDTGVFFHDSLDAIANRTLCPVKRDVLGTGFTHLDECGVGVERGEIGCILARSKGGKSHALLNVGYHALKKGLDVLYVNVEIKEDRLEDRWARRVAGKGADQRKDPDVFVQKLRERFPRLCKGRLKLKRYFSGNVTMNDVRSLLIQCHAEGFKPDVLLVDYVGIMKPSTAFTEERHRLDSLWLEFRGLCQEFNVFGWSAAQANRMGAASELVTMTDIAESFSIISHIDVGFSINRTQDEMERGVGRFFVFASRNDKDGIIVDFTEDLSRSLMTTTGIHVSAPKTERKRKSTTDEQKEDIAFKKAVANRNSGKDELPDR